MHLVLGERSSSATDAVRRKISQSEVPDRRTFLSDDRRLGEKGTFHGKRWDVRQPHAVRNVWLEKEVVEVVERQPTITARHLAAQPVTSQTSAHRALQEQPLCPCYLQSAQESLLPHDALAKRAFYQQILQQSDGDYSYVYSKGFIHGQVLLH
jgi:hypothetical protein